MTPKLVENFFGKDSINEPKEKIYNIIQGYITGFFDAEGMVRIEKDGTLRVAITQAYKPVLEIIEKEFKMPSGIEVHTKEGYDKRRIHRKGAWRWRQSSDKAIPFLDHVYEYSIEKRPQIELALRYLKDTRISHKYNRTGGMFRLSQSEIKQRKWYSNELERLKHIQYNDKEKKDYENELKKLSLGKQKTLIDSFDLNVSDKELGIEQNILNQPNNENNIPNILKDKDRFLGYIAGFYDGEGYVGIQKGTRDSYTLRSAINNSNLDILEIYANKYGGKIRPVKDKNKKEHHKNKWLWELFNNDILPFLKYILPYTKVKYEQIKYGIEFQEFHNRVRIIRTSEQKKKAEFYRLKLEELKKETGETEINEDDEEKILISTGYKDITNAWC